MGEGMKRTGKKGRSGGLGVGVGGEVSGGGDEENR